MGQSPLVSFHAKVPVGGEQSTQSQKVGGTLYDVLG